TFLPRQNSVVDEHSNTLVCKLAVDDCLFEAFSSAPGVEEVRECLRKQLSWAHARNKRDTDAPFPWLWIIAAGRPVGAMAGYAFRPWTQQHAGFYIAVANAMHLGLVVVPELPR